MLWMTSFIGVVLFFFFKQKTAYEMRISDWSSDVCSSDLAAALSLFEKIWNAHLVATLEDDLSIVHVDRHVLHEVSSARAFLRMQAQGRRVRNHELTFATLDQTGRQPCRARGCQYV